MQKIIFYHESREAQLLSLLLKNLSAQYAVTLLGESKVMTVGVGSELLLCEATDLHRVEAPDTILVFSEHCLPPTELCIDASVICIASSDNAALLKLLATTHARVITCGMSDKDTVNCSGKSEHSISVSLQREFINCIGQRLEPLELVLSFENGYRSYELLAYATILLLLGVVCECPKAEISLR